MLTALVFLTSSANKAGQGRMSGCLCGGGYLLSIEKHAAGALFLLGSPHPLGAAFAACQRFAACAGFESSLPNIPLLRYLYSLATPLITHSLCPKGKGQATLHAICCAASATTGSRHGCLFSSWKGMPRLQCMEPGTYTYWDLLVAVVS
jgi:hypothetical protein